METLGLLILRLTVGLIFIAHGLRQHLGWFGGGGMADVMRRLGLHPPKLWASLCGLGNLCGGLMIAAGALTVLGCALIITTMTVATLTLKAHCGFWERFGGYEYNLYVIGTSIAIALTGPGELSVDATLAPVLIDVKLFGLSLLACLAVAALGLCLRKRPAVE
jgi:putative oxidoreductase